MTLENSSWCLCCEKNYCYVPHSLISLSVVIILHHHCCHYQYHDYWQEWQLSLSLIVLQISISSWLLSATELMPACRSNLLWLWQSHVRRRNESVRRSNNRMPNFTRFWPDVNSRSFRIIFVLRHSHWARHTLTGEECLLKQIIMCLTRPKI